MTIKFVPGEGWVMPNAYNDGRSANVSAGSADIAYEQARKAEVNNRRRAMYGNYEQYMGMDNMSWLRDNVGDSWWWGAGRLDNLAHDPDRFWREFAYTSDDQYNRSAEIVNRYRALQESGLDKKQIQQALYGNANLSPSFNNGGGGGGVTGPGMLSGNAAGTSNGTPPAEEGPPTDNMWSGVRGGERRQRLGTWGSGYANGGYEKRQVDTPRDYRQLMSNDVRDLQERSGDSHLKMFSSENEQMRQAIATALEKKLLG